MPCINAVTGQNLPGIAPMQHRSDSGQVLEYDDISQSNDYLQEIHSHWDRSKYTAEVSAIIFGIIKMHVQKRPDTERNQYLDQLS